MLRRTLNEVVEGGLASVHIRLRIASLSLDNPPMSRGPQTATMPAVERRRDRADRRAARLLSELGEEIRVARQAGGLSQAWAGRAAGISQARVSRIEHGAVPTVNL